jgi:hypothetical protein
VKGVVTDLASGEPLKNVLLTFALAGSGTMPKTAYKSGEVIVKKTAGKGGFNIKSIPAGNYSVTCRKSGYAERTATIAITDGELSVLNMQLTKN